MKKTAFASDYDNTLYMHGLFRRGISKKDREVIAKYQQDGGLFGLCTGRPYQGFTTDPATRDMRIDFYIATTGAHVVSGDGEVLFEKSIPIDLAKEVFSYGKKIYRHSVQVDGTYFLYGSGWRSNAPIIQSLEEVRGRKIYGFSFRMPGFSASEELTARLNETFGDTITAFQNKIDIDIVAKGCSKGSGILFIKDYFHLDSVAGMGDSMNDVPLVRDADVGFTFPKSPSILKDASDRLAKSVGDAIRQFKKLS